MAHFAQLDENNVVTQVIVVHNNELLDNGVEREELGVAFCRSLFGANTRWVQTSYNGNIRKHYAGVGFTHDANRDAFIPPKPQAFPSFVLDEATCTWKPPIERPADTVYRWDEPSVSWVSVPQPYPSWTAAGDPLQWTPPVPRPMDGKRYKWDEQTLSWVEILQE